MPAYERHTDSTHDQLYLVLIDIYVCSFVDDWFYQEISRIFPWIFYALLKSIKNTMRIYHRSESWSWLNVEVDHWWQDGKSRVLTCVFHRKCHSHEKNIRFRFNVAWSISILFSKNSYLCQKDVDHSLQKSISQRSVESTKWFLFSPKYFCSVLFHWTEYDH